MLVEDMVTARDVQLENVRKLLETPETLNGFLRVFNHVIPKDLVIRVKTMLQENRFDKEVIGELTTVVVDYNIKLHNPSLWKDEKVLWGHNEAKDNANTNIWRTWAVTNHRAFVYDHNVESFEAVAGLLVSEVDVVNEHSKNGGVCNGIFSEAGKTLKENATPPSADESDQTCGDVVFTRDGIETLRFCNVENPWSLKVLVETALKRLLCDRPK